MNSFVDKFMHFLIGIGVGVLFWWLLERHSRNTNHVINPIIFLIMLIWGASGLFFFRKLGIPLLSHTFFYMAVPDWDIPLYNATKLRFLIHRSWLFHSVIIPTSLFGIWMAASRQVWVGRFQKFLVNLLRDGSIGLAVGISAHLIWDALLSSTRRGFYIHGFSSSASYFWLLINLVVGLGGSLLVAWSLQNTRDSSPIDL